MTDYSWDTSCADLELRRLQGGFTQSDFANFARVLVAGFVRAQADVHVQTGRLRASGHANVDESTAERWSGEISFGGGGVKWAASEFFGYSPKHGGYPSHAYFKRLGWQPQPRYGVPGEDVEWAVGPIRDMGSGGGIEGDMTEQVADFFGRGRSTIHPERGGA